MTWNDREIWTRIGLTAGAVWLGVMVIASALDRDFVWIEPYTQSMGPALVVTGAGLGIIAALCCGLRWIFDSIHKGKNS